MSNISSIDDLLMGVGNSQQPATPEHKDKEQQQHDPVDDNEQDDANVDVEYESDPMDEGDDDSDDSDNNTDDNDDDSDDKPAKKGESHDESEDELDEYGNAKERMPKGMSDRLARKEKQYQQEVAQRDREIEQLRQQLASQGASSQVQKAAADFKYDPNDEASWQQQLTEFVKHTVKNMNEDESQKQRQVQEQAAERAFHQKFQQGMERFTDFREVVGSQPIDNAMTLALRGMNDPTAFIYAASKRQPGELERIAKLPDPYARMVEMGKLEERMRRNKPITKTPRPLGRSKEDAVSKPAPKQKDTSGDDLLAQADAKRLKTVRNRHRANR